MSDDRPSGRRRSGLQKAIRARIAARRLTRALAMPEVRQMGPTGKKALGRLLAYQGGARRPLWGRLPSGRFWLLRRGGKTP